jgi:hypothetical protein
MLQSEAGYIDARPLTTISTKTLATHGRTIHLGQARKRTRFEILLAGRRYEPNNLFEGLQVIFNRRPPSCTL